MSEHRCARVLIGSGMVSTLSEWFKDASAQLDKDEADMWMVSALSEDSKGRCNKVARFRVPSGNSAVPDFWYCADCYDFYIAWNRMQHERYGVPLLDV